MSSISGISRVAQPVPAAPAKRATAIVKDADGDFDGTQPGQIDPKDAGKGLKVDTRA